jgi:hypothetical protein
VKTLFIAPGSPWENGYSESFNSRFRDEFLDRELFSDAREAAVLAEEFREDYNLERPHMSLGYLTPAEFAARSVPPDLLPRDAGELFDSPEGGESCDHTLIGPGTENGGIPRRAAVAGGKVVSDSSCGDT